MQKWLLRAAKELGIRIVVGYAIPLPDGNSLLCQALFPDLGGALGTIVLASLDAPDIEIRRILKDKGYSTSTFAAPLPNEEFDLESYQEMFAEWGVDG
jgi:hypothetical protein